MNWDDYFIGVAKAMSVKSHCLSHQFGAVVVIDNHILSGGYNGPPSGYPHCEGDVCPRHKIGYKSGAGLDICPAAHSEMNAVVNAAKYGISLKGATLYTSSPLPCRECAKAIVNAGIKQVVYNGVAYPDIGLTGQEILQKCGIIIRVWKEGG